MFVCTFIGNSVWKDDKGELWAKSEHPNPEVRISRDYDNIDDRPDLQFMIKYGEMKVHEIDETKQKPSGRSKSKDKIVDDDDENKIPDGDDNKDSKKDIDTKITIK